MLFIFGSMPKFTDLGLRDLTCRLCGHYGSHRVVKQQQRLSLFFIPVASHGTKFQVECPNCGGVDVLSKEEARSAGIA